MGFFRFLYRRVAREKNAITKQIKKADGGKIYMGFEKMQAI